jgi:hypothetical protein
MSIAGIGAATAQSYIRQVYPTQQTGLSSAAQNEAGYSSVTRPSESLSGSATSSSSPSSGLSSITMQALLSLTQEEDALDPTFGPAVGTTGTQSDNSTAGTSGTASSTSNTNSDQSEDAIDSNSSYLAALFLG